MFRAELNIPRAVELGFIVGGSETVRNEGSRFGASAGTPAGLSRGVPGVEDCSEPGVPRSLTSVSSGVAGIESEPSMVGAGV